MRSTRAVWTAASVVLVAVAVLLGGCGKDDKSSTTAKAPTEYTLTYQAYGPLHLGMTSEAAQATGLVQPATPGCELSGDPTETAASFVAPLTGAVDAAQGKVTAIWVRGGFVTSPGGLRVGDSLAKAQAVVWPGYTTKLDKGGEDTFGTWSLIVQHGEDSVLELSIDPKTQTVTGAGVPFVPTCD